MENNKPQNISTSVAIVVAGLLIMVGILLTRGGDTNNQGSKTLSEQVGVSKNKLEVCLENTNSQELNSRIFTSAENAMKNIPEDERGTPYSVIVGKDDVKIEVRGAYPYESLIPLIDQAKEGVSDQEYLGEILVSESTDRVLGNPDSLVKVIVYSDFECPYCKIFHTTLKKIVMESSGEVSMIFRHLPLQRNSFEKVLASECVNEIKGNDAFFKYVDLLFGLIKTSQDSISDQL